jgi:hypothetical protein
MFQMYKGVLLATKVVVYKENILLKPKIINNKGRTSFLFVHSSNNQPIKKFKMTKTIAVLGVTGNQVRSPLPWNGNT